MTRLEANRQLVNILAEVVEKNPDQRFGQILRNYAYVRENRPVPAESGFDWKNEFYLESEALLNRIYRSLYKEELEGDAS